MALVISKLWPSDMLLAVARRIYHMPFHRSLLEIKNISAVPKTGAAISNQNESAVIAGTHTHKGRSRVSMPHLVVLEPGAPSPRIDDPSVSATPNKASPSPVRPNANYPPAGGKQL